MVVAITMNTFSPSAAEEEKVYYMHMYNNTGRFHYECVYIQVLIL